MEIRPYKPRFDRSAVEDLRDRLRRTRWPPPAHARAWEQGTDLAYMKSLVAYWADEFDWAAHVAWLNSFSHYRASVDGITVHFVHHRAVGGDGVPLVLTHGWPSSFIEYLNVLKLLTDPATHDRVGPGFDVVVPSLPGYGFSPRPARRWTTRDTARVWHRLMGMLGYTRYGAHGTDFGAAVTTFLALDQPTSLVGIHLSNVENSPSLDTLHPPLSSAEELWLCAGETWAGEEGGYKAIQATRPQTLAYGLHDSPAGLAAWIVEKWRSWSDSSGDLDAVFSRDLLLTNITLYWLTGTLGTSIRDYADNRDTGYVLAPGDYVDVPTAIALYPHQLVEDPPPPREWVERMYRVQRWTVMPQGGHFAALEASEGLADNLTAFFGSL